MLYIKGKDIAGILRRKMRKISEISRFYMKPSFNIEEDYRNVVANYIDYYERRARKCKYQYYILNVIKFIALASIPIIQAIPAVADFPWIVTTASAVCLLMESILGLWKSKDKWFIYQDTNNILMSEQRQYISCAGIYKEMECPFNTFVERVENLINDEARRWNETVMKRDEKKDKMAQ